MKELYYVATVEEDQDYDIFERAAVWAESPEEAEAIVRAEIRFDEMLKDSDGVERRWMELWITRDDWRLEVTKAPTEGVVLVHWHAG